MSYGAITYLRRQYLCVLRRCAFLNAMSYLLLMANAMAAGPDILTDGRSRTVLNTQGLTTDISTSTISGQNAINSFVRFNIGSGQTVNLYVPTGAANLLNLVRDSRTEIDGVLNAYKDGRLGGNIFFFNPYGLVVGASGQINVGSLSISTPTRDFMDQMLDAGGRIDNVAIANAIAGRIPLSDSGFVTINGKVNASNTVAINATQVNVGPTGSIRAGAAVRADFAALVNVEGMPTELVTKVDGDGIRIVAAGDVNVAGTIAADGVDKVAAGQINIDAGGNIRALDGARISADGQGAQSNGGDVHLMAQGDASLENGSLVSARGGASGDGGNVEFSAQKTVRLTGGQLAADAKQGNGGNILIDPSDIEIVSSNVYTGGANYSLVANNSITVNDNIVISTRNVASPTTADHLTAASIGKSGDLTLRASHIELKSGSKLLAHGDSGFAGGNVNLNATDLNLLGAIRDANASLKLTNATITGNDIKLTTTADTSTIAALLAATSSGTSYEDAKAQAQVQLDKELDNPKDGPGGEFLALTTSATAKTEIYGSTLKAGNALSITTMAGARAGFEKKADAQTIIGDYAPGGGAPVVSTTLNGKTVDIGASATNSLKFNFLSKALTLADQSWLPDPDSGLIKALDDTLFDFNSVPLVSLATSKAKVDISGNTTITGTDHVTISSSTESAAKPTFSGLIVFSAAWAESDAEAKTLVSGTSHITTTGKASVTATSDVEIDATATVNSTNKPIDATFVHTTNNITTEASVGDGVVTQAGSIDVKATTTASLNASAIAKNMGGSGVGLALAMSESNTTTTATLGGTATADSGAIDVNASTTISKSDTSADASTLGDPSSISAKIQNFQAGIQRNLASGVLNATGKLNPATTDRLNNFLFPGIKEGKFNLSGAVAYATADNTASASIAANAHVKSATTLDVNATISDSPSASVGAKSTSKGAALGGSVILGTYVNHANAYIGNGATVDAKGALTVHAETKVPYPWEIDWSDPKQILDYLQGGVLDMFLSSYAINSSKGKDVGLSGAVSIMDIDNHANAWIAEGAKINTVYDKATMTLPDQKVSVTAYNEVNMVDAVGILSKKFLGTSGGKAAIGGSVAINDIEGEATATIRGDAEVRSANGVDVTAKQKDQLITVTEAGGSSDKIAIEGAVAINTIKNTTIAAIDDDAKIDVGGKLKVAAEGDVQTVSVGGGVAATKGQVGIGFSVGLNTISNDVSAYLGNYDPSHLDTVAAKGSVKTAGDLEVTAKAKTEIGSYSVAGAIASDSKAQTDMPSDAETTSSSSGGAGQGKFGIAVSGDASVNDVSSNTLAYISDGVNVSKAGNASLSATNDLAINALAGAVTISTKGDGNGLAGSFAMNRMSGKTAAYIADATVNATGKLSLDAKVDGEINTLSASVEGSKGKVGIAGSVSINDISNETTADIKGSSITGISSAALTSSDSSAIHSVAGALAFGGKAGIGLSFAWNKIGNTAQSYVDTSDLFTTGDLGLSASTSSDIQTISAAIGASKEGMAAAGAVAINQISNQTNAYLSGKKTSAGIDAGKISLAATDNSNIFAIVGAIGASAGKAGFGASFAWNSIDNRVGSKATGAIVDGSSLSFAATNTADIQAYAAGAAGASKVGVSGSLAINDITTQTSAISDSSHLGTSGDASITAKDTSSIEAVTGAVAGAGTAAVGASGSYNHISGTTAARVTGGDVTSSAGSVKVDAQHSGAIDVWAVAGSGAGTAGFAGSIAINDMGGSTQARIEGGANVSARNNVQITSGADDSISAKAGSVAFGGTVGGSGAVAVNDIHADTSAEVTGSATRVSAQAQSGTMSVDNGTLSGVSSKSLAEQQQKDNISGVAVIASSTSEVQSIIANAAGGGEAGVAATVSVNLLGGTTTASLNGGAKINESLSGASSAQEARVAAYHHDKINAGAGGLAVGGTAGVGGSADTSIISHTTTATVDGASMQAQKAVAVDARSTTETSQIVVGASGGGVAALNISATVLSVTGTTQAQVNNAALASHGSLDVKANSTLKTQSIVGSVDVSGAAGVGTSVIVNVINQTTQATTRGATTLNADGTVAVTAGSTQSIDNYAATISGSGGVGFAGSVAVDVVKGSTLASVGGSTQINQDGSFGGTSQDVKVTASDTTTIGSKLGGVGVGIGAAGIGAVADVSIVNNGATAEVQGGAKIDADRDVLVTSTTKRDVSSLTVAASGGFAAGVSGAVSYIGIGARADDDSKSELLGSVNKASSLSSGSATGSQMNADGGSTATRDRSNAARASLNVSNDFMSLPAATSSAAGIGSSAVIRSGRDVSVNASNQTNADAIAVGAAVSGGVSIGGGVAIAKVQDKTLANVSGSVTADRNISVTAADTQTDVSKLESYAGGAGLVGLGASVTIFDKTSTAAAQIGSSAQLNAKGTAAADPGGASGLIKIDAGIDHNIESKALGAAIGLGGVGAAIGYATEDGDASASVGANASLTGKSLDVHGHSKTTTTASTIAAAGGIIAGAGSDAKAVDKSSASATLDHDVTIRTVGGATQLRAEIDPVADARALSGAISAGVSVGVSLAKADVETSVSVTTGDKLDVQAASLDLNAQTKQRSGYKTAYADAKAAAGGSLLGAGATQTDAIAKPTTLVQMGTGNLVTLSGAMNLSATSTVAVDSNVSGLSLGFIAAGSNTGNSLVSSNTQTLVGGGTFGGSSFNAQATSSDELDASTQSGAGGLGALVAAKTTTTANATTTTKVTGTLNQSSVAIGATHTTDFQGTADSLMASVAGYSGANVYNTSNAVTRAELGSGSHVDYAQAFSLDALTNVRKGSATAGWSVQAASGGVLSGSAGGSYSTITNDTRAVIGDNVTITIAKPALDEGTLNVSARNRVDAYDSVILDTGGAIAIADTQSFIDASKNDANVTLGSGTHLVSDGSVNLESSTSGVVKTEAQSKTYGLAGAPSGSSRSTIATSNNVALNGARIESDESVTIKAGASNDLNADAETHLWNKTVVPINSTPEAHGQIVQNNTITIAATGISTAGITDERDAQSARAAIATVKDINLLSGEGTHVTRGYGRGTDLYREALEAIGKFFDSDVSLDITGGSTYDNSRSGVTVNGTLFAGTHHKQFLEFDASGSVVRQSEGMSFTERSNVALDREFQDRIDWLTDRYNAYKNDNPDVAAGFLNDINILKAKQSQIGVGTKVNFIDVNPAVAYTGNITITGSYLAGAATGELIAPGDSSIEVINNSNKFLHIKAGTAALDCTAALCIPGELGGLITLNGARVTTNADINARNQGGVTASFLDSKLLDRTSSPDPQIVLKNTYEDPVSLTAIKPEIHVDGDISNVRGLAKIESTGTVLVGSDIVAQTVDIATKGDFIKTFTLGFTHQGGNPTYSKEIAGDPLASPPTAGLEATYEAQAKADHPTTGHDAAAGTTTQSYAVNGVSVTKTEGSTIAGNNVFISGEKLNINGKIQSGLPDYNLSITDSDVMAAKAAGGGWIKLAMTVGGESVKDIFRPQIRWDAASNRIELGSIQVQGGYMQLYGDIFSTGSGSLNVMDGYGRIQVNNTSSAALALNRLDTGSGGAGVIKLIDTSTKTSSGKSLETTITRKDGAVVYSYNEASSDALRPTVSVSGARSATYNTRAQRRLKWINADTINSTEYATYYKKTTFGIHWNTEDPGTQTGGSVSTTSTKRISGDWLAQDARSDDYILDFTKVRYSNSVQTNTHTQHDTDCLGDLCVSTIFESRFDWAWSENNYYVHSLNASKPISINFIGYDTGLLNVTNGSNALQLQGAVRNLSGASTISAGSIGADAQAQIIARDLNLTATTGNIGTSAPKLADVHFVQVDLQSGGKLTASAAGSVSVQEVRGDMTLNSVSAGNGSQVDLRADGNIVDGNTTALDVQGGSIRLVSDNGAIGSVANPIELDLKSSTGVLDASAAKDIVLTETTGDMRVRKVESLAGDVTLSAPTGKMVDANDAEEVDLETKAQLLAVAKRARLQDADGAGDGEEATIQAYNAQKTQEYLQYWQMRNLHESFDASGASLGFTADAYDASFKFKLPAATAAQLKTLNGWSDTQVAAYEDQRTTTYHQAALEFGKGDVSTFNKSFKYDVVSSDSTTNANLRQGSSWSEAQITNRIAAGIFKDTSDTEVMIEDPNVVGRNVKLSARDGIGADKATLVLGSNPSVWSDDDKLALIAAERQDVTLDYSSKTITIRGKDDVDVTAQGGELTASSNKSIYIGSEADLQVKSVVSPEDVRIKTSGNLGSTAATGTAAVDARNITLESGHGDVGAASKYFVIKQAPLAALTARAGGNLYISNLSGDMTIDQVYAVKLASLNSAGAIVEATPDLRTDVQAKYISLTATTTIGKGTSVLDYLDIGSDPDGWVDLIGPKGIYVYSPSRTLNLRTISSVDGEFKLDTLAKTVSFTGSLTAAKDIALSSADTLSIGDGVTITSGHGKVTVDAAALEMGVGSKLDSLTDLVSIKTTGDATVGAVSAAKTISVDTGGDLSLTDKLAAGDDVTVKAGGTATLEAGVAVTSSAGAVGVDAGAFDMKAGSKIDSPTDSVTIKTVGDATITTVSAAKTIDVETGSALTLTDKLVAGDDVSIKSGGVATVAASASVLSSTGDVDVDVHTLDMKAGSKLDTPAGKIDVTTTEDATLGKLTSAKTVDVTSGGSTIVGGAIVSVDKATVTAGKDIVFAGGSISADAPVTLTAGSSVVGDPASHADVTAADVSVTAGVAIGKTAPLEITADHLVLESPWISVKSKPFSKGGPVVVSASGLLGGPADDLKLKFAGASGVTLDLLSATRSDVTTDSESLTVLDGRTSGYGLFFTPGYSIRIDAASRAPAPGYSVHAFTTSGRYTLDVDRDAATIGAFIISSDPSVVVYGSTSGSASATSRDALVAKSARAEPSARSNASAAGMLQISSELFECKKDDKKCEEILGKSEEER